MQRPGPPFYKRKRGAGRVVTKEREGLILGRDVFFRGAENGKGLLLPVGDREAPMTEPLLGVEQEIPAWSLQAAGTGAWSGPGAGRGIAGVSTREEAGASPLTLALTLGTSENAHLGERHHWRRIGHDDVVPESGDRRESLNRGDSASDPPAGFRVRRGSVSSVLWGGAGILRNHFIRVRTGRVLGERGVQSPHLRDGERPGKGKRFVQSHAAS